MLMIAPLINCMCVYLWCAHSLVVSEEPTDSWTPELVTTDPQEEDELTLAEGETPSMDVATLEALLSHPTLR